MSQRPRVKRAVAPVLLATVLATVLAAGCSRAAVDRQIDNRELAELEQLLDETDGLIEETEDELAED